MEKEINLCKSGGKKSLKESNRGLIEKKVGPFFQKMSEGGKKTCAHICLILFGWIIMKLERISGGEKERIMVGMGGL